MSERLRLWPPAVEIDVNGVTVVHRIKCRQVFIWRTIAANLRRSVEFDGGLL